MKYDFGNFKLEAEAVCAVDATFYHYGRPDLLNFCLQFLSSRPTAPPGLDEKAKVKFVKEEAKQLLAAIATSSPLHSHYFASDSGTVGVSKKLPFRSLAFLLRDFIAVQLQWSDDAILQPQPWILLDISTLSSMQISEQVVLKTHLCWPHPSTL